ncbi:MAG: ParB/RepB/Spo0J family partition protein [Spirochaetaceae bacterium]|nr:ParB/RepB/Spo0J family partition protein [Spirochaetaceae bacterium]
MTSNDTATVNLDRLHPSAAPIRRNVATGEAHAELVASIRAHGLLEPLVVDAQGQVLGGNRRLEALQDLVARGVLAADAPIPCTVVPDEADGDEIALAENTVRVAMHPVDQAVAFHGLHERGATLEQIAGRFGTGKRVVARRIRLAALAPPIMTAYKAGEITEELAHAFATTADQDRQMVVFNDMREQDDGDYYYDEYISRRGVLERLEQDKVRSDSWAAVFVGLDHYRAAGGPVEETLFEDYSTLTDLGLLERLAKERLDEEAAKITGWKWVQTTLGEEWQIRQSMGRIWPKKPEPTAAEQAVLDELAQAEANCPYGDELDALPAEQVTELRQKLSALRHEARTVQNELSERAEWSDEQRAAAGVLLYIDRRSGKLSMIEGLLREGDRNPDARPPDDEGGASAATLHTAGSGTPDTSKPRKPPEAHSQAVRDSITTLRTAVLRHALALDDQMAVDLLTFHLLMLAAGDLHQYGRRHHERALQLAVSETPAPPAAGATEALTQYCEPVGYDMSWYDPAVPLAEAFETYLELPVPKRAQLLAAVVANLLLPRRIESDVQDVIGVAAKRMEVVYAGEIAAIGRDTWSADLYWGRLRKDTILDEARPWLGSEWADNARKLKKRALAAEVAEKMRDHAASYLPEGFVARRQPAPAPDAYAD